MNAFFKTAEKKIPHTKGICKLKKILNIFDLKKKTTKNPITFPCFTDKFSLKALLLLKSLLTTKGQEKPA